MKSSLGSVFLIASISLFTVAGCGDDDDDTPRGPDASVADATPGSSADAAPDIATNCGSFCDNQGTATDCPEEVATQGVDTCKQLCRALVPSLDEQCTLLANAFFICSASSDSWHCLEGGNLPVQVDDACKAENEAYADCLASQ